MGWGRGGGGLNARRGCGVGGGGGSLRSLAVGIIGRGVRYSPGGNR